MIPLLRAECRKLLSVRSTYIITGLSLVLIGFMSFYVEGFRGTTGYHGWLTNLMSNASGMLGIFAAVVAILQMGHEYRYNTITYTLTAANNRGKVILAKIAVIIGYSLVLTLIAWLFAALMYMLGANLSPNAGQMVLSPDLAWGDVWRNGYFVLSFGLVGLLYAFLLRHVVGAMAVLFIWPTVEALLSPLLRHNARYLPLSLLEQIQSGAGWGPGKGALLFLTYLVIAWLIAWYLFLRRDATSGQ